MNKFKRASDDYLRATYVPDVYQHDIHQIDYEKLKSAGVKCLSFDIDDTIVGVGNPTLEKSDIIKFADLKNRGFILVLLSSALEFQVERFSKELQCDYFIAEVKKPKIDTFKTIQEKHGFQKSEMAHIGSNIIDDVGGGNTFGIITCLVRSRGYWGGFVSPPLRQGLELRRELKERKIWRKHHIEHHGDQYYQYGETQRGN